MQEAAHHVSSEYPSQPPLISRSKLHIPHTPARNVVIGGAINGHVRSWVHLPEGTRSPTGVVCIPSRVPGSIPGVSQVSLSIFVSSGCLSGCLLSISLAPGCLSGGCLLSISLLPGRLGGCLLSTSLLPGRLGRSLSGISLLPGRLGGRHTAGYTPRKQGGGIQQGTHLGRHAVHPGYTLEERRETLRIQCPSHG